MAREHRAKEQHKEQREQTGGSRSHLRVLPGGQDELKGGRRGFSERSGDDDQQSTQAAGTRPAGRNDPICREADCDNAATTGNYCRLHYIKNWAWIKEREAILREGRLERWIEEVLARFPEAVVNRLREDLSTEEAFSKALEDIDLEGSEAELAALEEEAELHEEEAMARHDVHADHPEEEAS